MKRRHVAAAIGVLAGFVGLAFTLRPRLTGGFEVNLFFLPALGIGTIALGAHLLRSRFEAERRTFVPHPPEKRHGVSSPGRGFDRAIQSGERIDETRLERVAIGVLTRKHDLTESEARAAVVNGTWTDDDRAAAFFADDFLGDSLWERLTRPPLATQARHVVTSLAEDLGHSISLDGADQRGGTSFASVREWLADSVQPSRSVRPHRTIEAPHTNGGVTTTDPRPVDAGAVLEYETHRWDGVRAAALVAAGIGILTREPSVLLLSVVLGVAASVPALNTSVDLTIQRELSEPSPAVGDEVTVDVTVRNEGGAVLPDLRIVDDVPDLLRVTERSPRHATSLRPGRTTSFSYTLGISRGEFAFGAPLVIARDGTGANEHVSRVSPVGDETISCRPPFTEKSTVPLRSQTTNQLGRLRTDAGGEGIEFHSTREYYSGDSLSRIDWTQLAKGRGLTTIEFREERAANVHLVIDARPEARLSPDGETPSAVEQSITAAGDVAVTLMGRDHRVGLTALAPDAPWLDAGTGRLHASRLEAILSTHPAFVTGGSLEPFLPTLQRHRLQRLLPAAAQVLVLAPLCDSYVVSLVKDLEAFGHPVTVLCPDPTSDASCGNLLARIERNLRIHDLRDLGVPVFDWSPNDPLSLVLERAARERSA